VRADEFLLNSGDGQRNRNRRRRNHGSRWQVLRQQRRIAFVIRGVQGHAEGRGKFFGFADLAYDRGLAPHRLDQVTQVFVVHPDRAVGSVEQPARRVRRAGLNHQHVTAVLIGNRGLPTHRLQHDHAGLAEGGCAVGGASAGADDAPQAIFTGGRVSVRQQGRARGIAVFAGGEVVRPAADRKGAGEPASRVVAQDKSSDTIAIRRKNNFNRSHKCFPLLFPLKSAGEQRPVTIHHPLH